MTPEIEQALRKFENAHYLAVKRDTEAEMAEEWKPSKLKKCEDAWTACWAAKAELIAELEKPR
jgi:hypothetical protein